TGRCRRGQGQTHRSHAPELRHRCRVRSPFLRRAARGHRGQGRRRADGDRHRDARRPYQYRGPGAPGLHRSGDLPPLTRTYRTRRRARLDLEGVGTTEGDGTTETEARGQGSNGIKGVAVGRTGVTVTVGAAGVTVGGTVAVT